MWEDRASEAKPVPHFHWVNFERKDAFETVTLPGYSSWAIFLSILRIPSLTFSSHRCQPTIPLYHRT